MTPPLCCYVLPVRMREQALGSLRSVLQSRKNITPCTGVLSTARQCEMGFMWSHGSALLDACCILTCFLAACSLLSYLDLSSNSLSGTIPDFSVMTALEYMALCGNAFPGELSSLTWSGGNPRVFLITLSRCKVRRRRESKLCREWALHPGLPMDN
jgi:hypothetical protein